MTELSARHTTVILVCSEKPPVPTSLQFWPGINHDIYFIYNFALLSDYVEKLIDKIQNASDYAYENLSIILVADDITILMQAIELLYKKQLPESSIRTKENFVSMYKRSLSSAYDSKELCFDVVLPPGLVDVPLGFETYILQNCDGYSHLEHLSESHIWKQQILRFMALKHGASFGAVSGIYGGSHSISTVFDFVDNVRSRSSAQSADHSVFDKEGLSIVDDLLMHQFIPSGEDTWGKLILLAKSTPQVKKSEKIIASELQLQEISEAYDATIGKASMGIQGVSNERVELMQLLHLTVMEQETETVPNLALRDLLKNIQVAEVEVGDN